MNIPLNQSVAAQTKTHGLRTVLYRMLIVSLVVPGILSGLILIYLNLLRGLEQDVHARAGKLADLMQAGLEMPLWNMAPATGQQVIDAVFADTSVASVVVSDEIGRVLFDVNRQIPSLLPPVFAERDIRHDGVYLGRVKVAYATAGALGEAERASIRLFIIIASQLLLSILILGGWLRKHVLQPVEGLRESADKIAQGDLKTPVQIHYNGEFGALAGQMDAMRDSLARAVAELESRVQARTEELSSLNLQLQETLEHLQKTQSHLVQSEKLASLGALVAGLAHELNTPIGTGVTVVSTIADKCSELQHLVEAGIKRSQLEAMLSDIARASALGRNSLERAAHLISDFKQMAVDQTSSRRRQFALDEIVREMMVGVSLRHKRAPVSIETQVDEGILMDSFPGLIEQILGNLIDNAVLHGAQGREHCHVLLSAFVQSQSVEICVRDDGNGIAAEHLSHLFDPFFTTRLGEGGSGLGLSIVYSLVTGLLGGEISVESTRGQGATFVVRLPLVAPDRADEEASGARL